MEKKKIMNLNTDLPINLIRLAKFFAKTTDQILLSNFKHQAKVPLELLDIKDIIS